MTLSAQFTKYYFNLQKRVNRLPLLGRVLTLLGSLLVIFIVWFIFFQIPLLREENNYLQRVKALEEQAITNETEAGNILSNVSGDKHSQQRKELFEEANKTDQYLNILKGEIIPPQEMSSVLREVLDKVQGLKLIGFKIKPKRTLVNLGENSETKISLYEQDVEMRLSGTYFENLNYLNYLENLRWRFFWNDIEYTVNKYPQAQITIKLHTLGQ